MAVKGCWDDDRAQMRAALASATEETKAALAAELAATREAISAAHCENSEAHAATLAAVNQAIEVMRAQVRRAGDGGRSRTGSTQGGSGGGAHSYDCHVPGKRASGALCSRARPAEGRAPEAQGMLRRSPVPLN